jgi:hypothetical protein
VRAAVKIYVLLTASSLR